MKKKVILGLAVGIGIAISSKIAMASTSYSFRLPATGSMTTSQEEKTHTGDKFVNIVSYIGKTYEKVNFWGQITRGTCTSTGTFSSNGTYTVKYEGGGARFKGERVHMLIKTGPTTFTEVDVEGKFIP